MLATQHDCFIISTECSWFSKLQVAYGYIEDVCWTWEGRIDRDTIEICLHNQIKIRAYVKRFICIYAIRCDV